MFGKIVCSQQYVNAQNTQTGKNKFELLRLAKATYVE
jgi:hypothetical protein